MSWSFRLSLLWSGIAGWFGAVEVPTDPAERSARVWELYGEVRSAFPEVPELRPESLLERPRDYVVIDVRPEEERQVSIVPGAIPAEAVEADREAWRGRRLVAYCTIGVRSGKWARRERELGLDVANLAGGVLGWSEVGGGFTDSAGPTRRVHVYGPAWSLLPEGYEAIW